MAKIDVDCRAMPQTASRFLLTVFLLSVSIIPLIEAGHDLLHAVKNPFHSHEVRQTSRFAHGSKDHSFFGRKMKFAHQMNDTHTVPNLIWLAYSFFTSIEDFAWNHVVALCARGPFLVTADYLVMLLPPVPPPQHSAAG